MAESFAGRARAAKTALINEAAGAVWSQGGKARVVFSFTITHRKIAAIELLADPEVLQQLEISVLND